MKHKENSKKRLKEYIPKPPSQPKNTKHKENSKKRLKELFLLALHIIVYQKHKENSKKRLKAIMRALGVRDGRTVKKWLLKFWSEGLIKPINLESPIEKIKRYWKFSWEIVAVKV